MKSEHPEVIYIDAIEFLHLPAHQNVANLFCTGSSDEAIKKAIVMSRLRKKLYERGDYKPMIYAYFWPREDLLKWFLYLSN